MGADDPASLPEVTAAAIELLARNGYEATTVSDLADQVGMSRSTFFRRFGSKEDVVFADHDFLLQRVRTTLGVHAGDPFEAVAAGTRLVLDYHLGRPEATRFRYELLHANPALRDRELVSSNRYERAFSSYLRTALDPSVTLEWVPVAFASSAVAVHNLALRSWLRRGLDDPEPALRAELAALAEVFRALLGDERPAADPNPRVVVAVVEPGQTAAQVLRGIADSLT